MELEGGRHMRYTRRRKKEIGEYQGQRRNYRDDWSDRITKVVYVCPMCRREFDLDDLEVDHIIPVSVGGPDTLDNLRLLCTKDNRKKGKAVSIKGKLVRLKPRTVKKKGSTTKKKRSTTKRRPSTVRKKPSTVKRKTSTTKRRTGSVRMRRSTTERKATTVKRKRR
jgi:5-methylcytosine-specific restriction endonuclease McrA